MSKSHLLLAAGLAVGLGVGSWWIAVPTAAAKALPAAAAASNSRAVSGICVRGFSKDACASRVDFTDATIVTTSGCPDQPSLPGCRTVSVQNALLRGSVRPSSGACGSAISVRCDEFCDIGPFSARFDFDLDVTRDACQLRGCWRASDLTFSGTNLPVVIIEASAAGTLGTGSHRVGCQNSPTARCDLDNCENCRDVEFIPSASDPTTGTWRIGLEGMITGRVVSCPQRGGEVCVMIQGDLFARGTSDGITNLWDGFDLCATLDGVTITRCE